MKWEYATARFNGSPIPVEEMNQLGAKGWELVAVVGPSDRASTTTTAYFKREARS